jgi:hypothetical protein
MRPQPPLEGLGLEPDRAPEARANGLLWLLEGDPVWAGHGIFKPCVVCRLKIVKKEIQYDVVGPRWIFASTPEMPPSLAGPIGQGEEEDAVMSGVYPELRAFVVAHRKCAGPRRADASLPTPSSLQYPREVRLRGGVHALGDSRRRGRGYGQRCWRSRTGNTSCPLAW